MTRLEVLPVNPVSLIFLALAMSTDAFAAAIGVMLGRVLGTVVGKRAEIVGGGAICPAGARSVRQAG
jgi:putative Mn2+ efflux pump MntP